MFDPKEISKKYLGIPYKHMGRDLKGLDCWGLAVLIYKEKEIDLFDLAEYEEGWARKRKNLILGNYYQNWIKVQDPQCGDVILIKNLSNMVSHAGIYLEYGKFIHSFKPAGVIVSRMFEWKEKIEGCYRYHENKNNS